LCLNAPFSASSPSHVSPPPGAHPTIPYWLFFKQQTTLRRHHVLPQRHTSPPNPPYSSTFLFIPLSLTKTAVRVFVFLFRPFLSCDVNVARNSVCPLIFFVFPPTRGLVCAGPLMRISQLFRPTHPLRRFDCADFRLSSPPITVVLAFHFFSPFTFFFPAHPVTNVIFCYSPRPSLPPK